MHADLGDDRDDDEDQDVLAEVRGDRAGPVQGGERVAADAQGERDEHERHLEDTTRAGGGDGHRGHQSPPVGEDGPVDGEGLPEDVGPEALGEGEGVESGVFRPAALSSWAT